MDTASQAPCNTTADAAGLSRSGARLCVTIFLVALCSIVYQLLVAKVIARFAGDAALWEAISVGVFIGALAVGAFAGRSLGGKTPLRAFVWVEYGLSIVGLAAMLFVILVHMLYRIWVFDAGLLRDPGQLPPAVWFGVAAQLAPAAIGLLSGFEMPLLLRAFADRSGGRIGWPIAAWHFGAFAGTLLFAASLLRGDSPLAVTAAVCFGNLVIAVGWSHAVRHPSLSWRVLSASCAAAIIAFGFFAAPHIEAMRLKNFYYNRWSFLFPSDAPMESKEPRGLVDFAQREAPFLPAVESWRSPYQQIDLVTRPMAGSLAETRVRGEGAESAVSQGSSSTDAGDWSLFMDGRFQVSPRGTSDYHEALAHVPIMVRDRVPQRVLVVGGGDGVLVREILRYGARVTGVTLVDIDPMITQLAKEDPRLLALNRDALRDTKVSVVNADALHWVRTSRDVFDGVYLDLTYPFDLESTRLFTREMFALIRQRLAPGGFLVMPTPLELIDEPRSADDALVADTLAAGGFPEVVGYRGRRDTFVLTAAHAPIGSGAEWVANFARKHEPEFPLESLTSEVMRPGHARVLAPTPPGSGSKRVHSLFRPAWFGAGDPFN